LHIFEFHKKIIQICFEIVAVLSVNSSDNSEDFSARFAREKALNATTKLETTTLDYKIETVKDAENLTLAVLEDGNQSSENIESNENDKNWSAIKLVKSLKKIIDNNQL
jgi:hypothetical protein